MNPAILTIAHEDAMFRMHVPDRNDHIARALAEGHFYEAEELELMRRHVAHGAVIVEVGANIGNHTVYFEKVLQCKRNVVFEVNPVAIEALERNIGLNDLQRVDKSFLGVAVADRDGRGSLSVPKTNLGGASFNVDDTGTFECRRGDEMLPDLVPDFIKIDVEGSEMAVLGGLERLIGRSRPLIFVEVASSNQAAFEEWIFTHEYTVLERFKRYRPNENFLISSKGRACLTTSAGDCSSR